ncbi:MAG: hypothetical protein JSS86_22490 [Cyanobacteria bacterium SZAS LIN-2]|nr:hypothetical protein [Cyanobacteria bacterium SZAS LIN-2]
MRLRLPSVMIVSGLITAAFLACHAQSPKPVPVKASPPGSVSALHLKQTHYYWDDTELYLSNVGLRLNNLGRMGFSLVAAAPDWEVTVFRQDDKTCVRQSLDSFARTGLVSDFLLKRSPRTFEQSVLARRDIKFGKFPGRLYSNEREIFEFLPLAPYAAPPCERIIFTVYKIPTNRGIPMKCIKLLRGVDGLTGRDRTGDQRVYLVTRRIEMVNVSPEIFQAPKGYLASKSIQEVILSKENRSASGDLDELFEAHRSKRK